MSGLGLKQAWVSWYGPATLENAIIFWTLNFPPAKQRE